MEPLRSWAHQPAGGNTHGGGETGPSPAPPRPGASFGPGTPQHQPRQSPPQPHGIPFPPFHQGLASLAGLSQQSPRQPTQSHRPDEHQSRLPQGPGYGLPSLHQATGQPSALEREREREREREAERIHIKEEEDRRHREQERQRMEQAPPHQAAPGPSMHLHQPVAVGPRTVHGPNGLLANSAISGPQPPPHLPLGAPSGPGNIFAGGPVQPAQPPTGQNLQAGLLGPYSQGGQTPASQQPPQAQVNQVQGQAQVQTQGPGQQPILNDALSYLDQVKVQFSDQPDVYNRFLDIMKDFKSGAIDTPGVIGRVSTLFAGNPELIQGFNTFLPPGYRIECGTGDDPNAIRVTTPMGTTVSSMPQPRPLSRQDGPDSARRQNGTYTPQPAAQSAQMLFSPSGRPVGPAAPGQPLHLSPLEAARQQEQQAMAQQQERGVSSLQNAISAATGATGLRVGMSPRATPMPAGNQDAAIGGDVAAEKRGPVEFNHAISYVNKIKNRFASHPDIYKQFLEILQTYQRESKPIQDVYSQVTHLFKTAPDLLEDFKQFLPESAAQAKQAAERARQEAEGNVMMSNVRSEGGALYGGSPVMSRETQAGTPAHARSGLPPVGNFAPTPVSKDNKRKRDQRQGTVDRISDGIPGPSGAKSQLTGGPANKRLKTTTSAVAKLSEQPPTSPSLVPSLPVPLEPTTTTAATSDELSFFDKAKKTIGNKNTFNEFLKLCNLFSQDLIDRSTLVFRAGHFIGHGTDLMKWFKDWLGYEERDIVIDNKPRVPSGRVMLSNCRGLGPSYRLLPKRERQKPCSGRDELCNSVLNDEWASHPTWASEDSGFIAHRKNVHEEGLHRIEEERHDYDYNIEACSRTIQLLEPLATQLRRLDDHAQRNFVLPAGLGGQSETIYKRIIMKLYGREKGAEVITTLHERPYQVIPVLLNRLKERLETWKMAQREWEKVWREQTQKMFWRSLDHQAADQKKNDRRQFQTKTLQGEIQVKYEEMKRQSNADPTVWRKPQMEFTIEDQDVLVDTTYLVLVHVEQAPLSTEYPKLATFIRDFVSLFFGLDQEAYRAKIEAKSRREDEGSSNGDVADEPLSGGEDSNSVKSRKSGIGKSSLLRTTLDRGRKQSRNDGSNASPSRASTPDVGSSGDGEMVIEAIEDAENKPDVSTSRWLEHPVEQNELDGKNINPNEPQPRHQYRLWANTNIYCFVRLFVMLYERLCRLKASEADVRETVRNASRVKPAIDLGIIDKLPDQFFDDTSETADYYVQMLDKFADVLRGDDEVTSIEDTLRRFYLQSGYPLYPFEKIITTIARDALQVMNSDSKDKSADIFALFKKDRQKDTITAQQGTDYRKAVEKLSKETEMYAIDFVSGQGGFWPSDLRSPRDDKSANKVKLYLSKKDDPIADDGLTALDREVRWRYYIASYTSIDQTQGVDLKKLSWPFMISNIKGLGVDPNDESFPPTSNGHFPARFLDIKNDENLKMRISVDQYRTIFQPDTQESFHANLRDREGTRAGIEAAEELLTRRDEAMKDNLLMNNQGMKDLAKEDVEKKNMDFTNLIEKGRGSKDIDAEDMEVDE